MDIPAEQCDDLASDAPNQTRSSADNREFSGHQLRRHTASSSLSSETRHHLLRDIICSEPIPLSEILFIPC